MTDLKTETGMHQTSAFLSKQMRTTHRDDRIKGLAAAQISESKAETGFGNNDFNPKMHGSLIKNVDYKQKLFKEQNC
jgi:hypothetical protein